jgi:hypothetical protein
MFLPKPNICDNNYARKSSFADPDGLYRNPDPDPKMCYSGSRIVHRKREEKIKTTFFLAPYRYSFSLSSQKDNFSRIRIPEMEKIITDPKGVLQIGLPRNSFFTFGEIRRNFILMSSKS